MISDVVNFNGSTSSAFLAVFTSRSYRSSYGSSYRGIRVS